MSRKTWVKDNLYITYGNGSLISHEDNIKIQNMEDIVYLYYDIDIFDGSRNIFHAKTYNFPKVLKLPKYIDYIVQLKEEDMFLYQNCQYNKQLYSFIDIKDAYNIEYFYKIEKIISYTRQSNDDKWDRCEEYSLTIGQSMYDKCHGRSVFIEHLTKDDLLRLKQTAINFVNSMVDKYSLNVKNRYKQE